MAHGAPSAAKAPPFPKPDPRHPSYLNLSTIDGADLSAIANLDRARKLTGIEFVMVLLPSLPPDQSLEVYANRLFAAWNIGRSTGGKGVLYLLVEDSHALKIEVSYGLEPVFTDGFCGSFQEQIALYFASKQFGDVLCNLINVMVTRWQRHEEGGDLPPYDAKELPDLEKGRAMKKKFLSGGAGIVRNDLFYDKDLKLARILDQDKEVLSQFAASADIEETVQRYFKSLQLGINYPFLDFLTEGSRYMRIEYPRSPVALRDEWREYMDNKPYKIVQQGDFAVVRFLPGARVFPLLLRRDEKGLWRIDMTKGWALLGASYDMKAWTIKVTDNPWMFAYRDIAYKPSGFRLPDPIPFPQEIENKIEALQARIKKDPSQADNYFQLADILFWECYWIHSAIDTVEEGLKHDPDNVAYRWLAIEMRYRHPLMDGIPVHYEALLRINPKDKRARWEYAYFCRTFLKDEAKAVALEKAGEKD